MKGASENLRKDGFLQSVLFLRLQSGERGILPLELPNTHEEKEIYFARLGISIEGAGKAIDEALFLSESWYVSQDDAQGFPNLSPSQHPNRREAIIVVGRNALETRQAFVIQTFDRDAQNRPVLGEVEVEEYQDEESRIDKRAVGLLDYLFPPR